MSCGHHHHNQPDTIEEEEVDIECVTEDVNSIIDAFSAVDECKSPSSLSREEIVQYLLKLQQMMQDRAETYRTFDRGLQIYRENEDAVAYQQLCGSITQRFSDVSKTVLEIESALNNGGASNWGSQIRVIQNAEREKLRLTVHLNMLHVRFTVLSEDEYNEQYITASRDFRRELGESVNIIAEVMEEVQAFVHDYDE